MFGHAILEFLATVGGLLLDAAILKAIVTR